MQPEPFDVKAEAAKISANGSAAREKRRQMLAIIRAEIRRTGRKEKKLSHLDWMRMQIWAQEQVGISVTPEQRREVKHEYYSQGAA